MSLEYTASNGLSLIKDGQPGCVVPSNVKYDKNAPMTAADLASHGVLAARVVAAGALTTPDPLPPLKPGVKIVFSASPDPELGEYLRGSSRDDFVVAGLFKEISGVEPCRAGEAIACGAAREGWEQQPRYV
jgi:hypothetical protein